MINIELSAPNLLSLSRPIFGAFVAMFCVQSQFELALVFALISEASDIGDGFLARQLKQTSDVGQILDGVCDSVYHFLVFVGLLSAKLVSPWLVLLIYSVEISSPYMRAFCAQMGHANLSATGTRVQNFLHAFGQLLLLTAVSGHLGVMEAHFPGWSEFAVWFAGAICIFGSAWKFSLDFYFVLRASTNR